MKMCEITCSDGGKNMVDGREHYWTCGRPAKYSCGRKSAHERRPKWMCGIHAAAERKISEKHGFKPPTPMNIKAYLAKIGAKGGKSKSPAKTAAARKANAARWRNHKPKRVTATPNIRS